MALFETGVSAILGHGSQLADVLPLQSWVWFMHPEEKWLPGKVLKSFRAGDAGSLELEGGAVSAPPAASISLSRAPTLPARCAGVRGVGRRLQGVR